MSEIKQSTENTPPDPKAGGTAAAQAPREKDSGRIAFDARGNAVWEWRTGDGQFERDASTSLVRKLEVPELRLEATAIVQRHDAEAKAKAERSTRGFDPYDNGAARAKVGRPSAAVRPPAQPAAQAPRANPGLLQQLRSWVGRKRR